MKHPSLLLALFALFGCASKAGAQEQYLSFDETVHRIDSICKVYFMTCELNEDYIRQHPIPVSQWEKVELRITIASPVSNRTRWEDELGTFQPLQNLSAKDHIRIHEMEDSLSASRKWQQSGVAGVLPLDENHDISYDIMYDGLKTDSMWVLLSRVDIINRNSNDTVRVEPLNHRYQLISNPPLIFATILDVEWKGHVYAIQEIFDTRTRYNRKKKGFQYTRACYQIK